MNTFRLRRLLFAWLITTTTLLHAAGIDWQTWNDASTADAQERNVPIFLFIGDPLNEFTGAMERDTFANPDIAAFLQENFVCVRATRDTQPGLAAYGQQWLAAEQKLPGWPLNLWFTPDQGPIEAASYLPPTEEWGREGFMVVAGRIATNWTNQSDAVSRAADRRRDTIADYLPFAAEGVEIDAALAEATERWLASHDATTGTWGESPHRAEPELLRFLMQRGGPARATALSALKVRLQSPLRDPVDGGIFRATVDPTGTIPVFQKRLTDQARFALACLDAARIDDDPIFREGARSVIDYAINRLSPGDGTFIIGEDATLDPAGLRQTWSWAELVDAVGEEQAAAFGARAEGNIDPESDLEGHHTGRNLLRCGPLHTASGAGRQTGFELLRARQAGGDARLHVTADAAAHALMLHVMQRSAVELADQRHGSYLLGTRAVLLRDFGAAPDREFTHLAGTKVPPLPSDHYLVGLALADEQLISTADTAFYEAEFGLYYATAEEVLGLRPLMWSVAAGEMPGPDVWRVMLPRPDEMLVTEITAAFDNPDVLPSGAVLLALQTYRQRE